MCANVLTHSTIMLTCRPGIGTGPIVDLHEDVMTKEQSTPLRAPPLPPWHTLPQDHPMKDAVDVLSLNIEGFLVGKGLRVWKAHGADGRVRFSFALTSGQNRERFVALFVVPVDNGRRFRLECEWIGAPRNRREYESLMGMVLPLVLGDGKHLYKTMFLKPRLTNDLVLELYQQRKEEDPTATLKQFCAEVDANYASVRAQASRKRRGS
jgi:hypothetical protein